MPKKIWAVGEKMFDAELDNFKRKICLQSYAAAYGYTKDRSQSWATCTVMRHVNGDKIFIGVVKGYQVYWSPHDDNDKGTIIEFVQRRLRLSLGAVRKELRPWMGEPPVVVPVFTPLRESTRDRAKMEGAYARMQDATNGHPYLERERAITASLLAHDRFSGRIRIDGKGNAVFPHFDQEELTGYELKNLGFTGFAPGGSKSLWMSQQFPDDNRLVITESAIDSLSYWLLFPATRTRFASIGGKPSPQQPELIRAAAARMPADSQVVAAMDADQDGAKLADVVRKAVALTGRVDLKFTMHEPFGFKDWNDQLRARPLPSQSHRPEVTSAP